MSLAARNMNESLGRYHTWITKGKGSECFTASKTPVGHVMTWFRIVRNTYHGVAGIHGLI